MKQNVFGHPKYLSNFSTYQTNNIKEWSSFIENRAHPKYYTTQLNTYFQAYFNSVNLNNIEFTSTGANSTLSYEYEHAYNSYIFYLLLSGNSKLKHNNLIKLISEGDTLLISPGNTITALSTMSPIEVFATLPCASIENFIANYFRNDLLTNDTILNHCQHSLQLNFSQVIIETIRTLTIHPHITTEPLISCQYEQFMYISFLNSFQNLEILAKTTPLEPKIIKIVEEYIEANIDQPIRLEDLAAISGSSAATIRETFKKHRNHTPSQFLRDLRLRKARKILQKSPPRTSITAVALSCGFASHAHFSFSYQKKFGETPSETLRKDSI